MPVKRRIRISLVLLCITAILFGVCKWWFDMGVWGAAWNGNLPDLRRRLDYGANPDSSWQGRSALGGAIVHHHREVAVLLLQRGADPNNAVYAAVKRGDPALVALMFTHGLDVHGKETRSALSTAIEDGRADMVALLLRHGINPNARGAYDRKTPLQEAHAGYALEQHDSARILALLRAAGAK